MKYGNRPIWPILPCSARPLVAAVYDRACKEAEPTSTTGENRKLMQKYLLGPRGLKRKPGRKNGWDEWKKTADARQTGDQVRQIPENSGERSECLNIGEKSSSPARDLTPKASVSGPEAKIKNTPEPVYRPTSRAWRGGVAPWQGSHGILESFEASPSLPPLVRAQARFPQGRRLVQDNHRGLQAEPR